MLEFSLTLTDQFLGSDYVPSLSYTVAAVAAENAKTTAKASNDFFILFFFLK